MIEILLTTALLLLLVAFALDAYHVARAREQADRAEAIRAALLLLLVAFALDAWHVARAKEQADRAEAIRYESMDRAMTDMGGKCWVCLEDANPLELVDSGHRFDLCCGWCAAVVKANKQSTRRAA